MRTLSRLSHSTNNLFERHAGGGSETRHSPGLAVHGCGGQVLGDGGVRLELLPLGQPGGEPAHFPGGQGNVSDAELRAELSEGLVFGSPGLDGGVGVGQRLEEMCLNVQIVTET